MKKLSLRLKIYPSSQNYYATMLCVSNPKGQALSSIPCFTPLDADNLKKSILGKLGAHLVR